MCWCVCVFFFSSRRRHTRCALVTGVQTCALPISPAVPGPGERLAVEEAAYKRYACCRFGHTALDILLSFREAEGLDADAVSKVRIGLFRDGLFQIGRAHV